MDDVRTLWADIAALVLFGLAVGLFLELFVRGGW